jgi:hypothetical protein
MQVKNPQYNALNTIDCEIEHPQFGLIAFTASPDDIEPMGRYIYAQAVAGNYGPVGPCTLANYPDVEGELPVLAWPTQPE